MLSRFMLMAVLTLGLTSTALAAGEAVTDTTETMDTMDMGNKICPISGEAVGGKMGEPFVVEYKGHKINLCCEMCKKDFEKDPELYMQKIHEQMMEEGEKMEAGGNVMDDMPMEHMHE